MHYGVIKLCNDCNDYAEDINFAELTCMLTDFNKQIDYR